MAEGSRFPLERPEDCQTSDLDRFRQLMVNGLVEIVSWILKLKRLSYVDLRELRIEELIWGSLGLLSEGSLLSEGPIYLLIDIIVILL